MRWRTRQENACTTRSQVGAVIVRAVVLMLLLIVLNPRLALGENALALSIEIDAEATGGAGSMTAMGVRREKAALSSLLMIMKRQAGSLDRIVAA